MAVKHLGGDWLLDTIPAAEVFTPEALSEEHRLIRQTAAEFVRSEVLPALDELEKKNWGRARELMRRAGELGLLGTDVPERLGGLELDKVASIVIAEEIGASESFAMTFGAQTGLGIVPILCFGTPDQQRRYLPRIVSAEILGAYCLSESGSGSDALGARARATRQPDGSWILNGEKMWTTSGGFADFFIVFAKADGEHFSAFIVERGFPGVAHGKEEHKMGLHGSSTTPLVLTDARVPADNLLGEVGKGHKIAFNVLNYGRFKLAATCTGGAKAMIAEAAAYASVRRQFGQPIARFGAIRHKLAEMTIRCYAVESMLYRTAGLIDAAIGSSSDAAAALAALEEFAIESSLLKVAGSEMIAFVADENVQIHGGNGFVRDYAAERHYRDVRVDRIFEGTNEINRLLVPAMLIKRSQKGGLALADAVRALEEQEEERDTVAAIKKTALLLLGTAMRIHGDKLADEQEVVMLISDVILAAFAAGSATARAERARHAQDPLASLHADAASVIAHDAGLASETLARTAIAAMTSGDEQRKTLTALGQILKVGPVNTVAARRRIADLVTERKRYIFG